jgi:hypothetical protein
VTQPDGRMKHVFSTIDSYVWWLTFKWAVRTIHFLGLFRLASRARFVVRPGAGLRASTRSGQARLTGQRERVEAQMQIADRRVVEVLGPLPVQPGSGGLRWATSLWSKGNP